MLAGDRFTADAAMSAGVVSHLAPMGNAKTKAHELAARLTQGTPDAVSATKRLLIALESDDFEPDHWEELRREILASPERKEAVARAKQAK